LKHLVVARHLEDLSWLESLPDDWTPFVVYKDVDIPNKGREASSYFYALQKLSYGPGDTLAFVQGHPGIHGHHFIERLNGPMDGFTWLSEWVTSDDHYGYPHHPDLPLADKWREWFNEYPPDRFEFGAGAQFAIPGSLALKHDKQFYASMFEHANQGNAPWLFERYWQYIFEV
jgi:hypothetical protein